MNSNNQDVIYCVTAFIDLLGFSSHLEIGNDLRTQIGQEAVKRLGTLEKAVDLIKQEAKKVKKLFPENLNFQRINDAIILTIDLPEFLTPSIGESVRRGMTGNEINKYFKEEDLETEEKFKSAYINLINESTGALLRFIGLVSRIHSYINRKENENYYPGAKTVIATGFRKSFITSENKEDFFSANFSFSNAYVAEGILKGAKFYIDNYILQMLANNSYSKNIMRYAVYVNDQYNYDPLEDYEDVLYIPNPKREGESIEVQIFRKKYLFREMNSFPLAYLQLLPDLLPYLEGTKKIRNKKHLFMRVFNDIKESKSKEELEKGSSNYLSLMRNDLEEDLRVIRDLLIKGGSKILDKQREENLLKIGIHSPHLAKCQIKN